MDDQQALAQLLLKAFNLPNADFTEETIGQVKEQFHQIPDWESFPEHHFPHLVALTGEAIFRRCQVRFEGGYDDEDRLSHSGILVYIRR